MEDSGTIESIKDMTEAMFFTPAQRLPKPFYEDAWCQLFHADCREILPLLELFDCVITDPPYGIGFKYESHKDKPEGYIDMLWPLLELAEVRCRGYMAVFQAAKNCLYWTNWFPRHWELIALPKKFGQILPSQIQKRTDYCLFWHVDKRPSGYRREFDGIARDWFVSQETLFGRGIERGHPCPRPIDTMRYLISLFSSSLTLDPFAGSGTTGVAAKQLGRKSILIELEEKYCTIAADRLRNTTPSLFAPAPPKQIQESLFTGDK